MKRIAVFCGSSSGSEVVFREAAIELGTYLAHHNLSLVYGGGNVGLMGHVADAVLANNGEVIGMIPSFLKNLEVAHAGLTDLLVTETMHERKALMAEYADGFITLPGGFGTLDELFEILTWRQLSIHQKPVGLLNIGGYFTPLLQMVDQMVASGFLSESNRGLLLVGNTVEELLAQMVIEQPPAAAKWVDREKI